MYLLTLTVMGEGLRKVMRRKFFEKSLFSPNNNTALSKQISLFDTDLVMANT